MKGNKRNKSVADFPAEFFTIWELAAQRKLCLLIGERGKATNFRQRLYTFRKRLIEESPQVAQPFMSVDIKIERQLDGQFVVMDYVPSWKEQVNQLAKNTQITSQVILQRQSQKEEVEQVTTAVVLAELSSGSDNNNGNNNGNDTLEETLKKFNYTTDSSRNNNNGNGN